MADTPLIQLAMTGRNPSQEAEYQRLLTASGIPFEVRGGQAYVEGFGTGGNDFGEQARAFFGTGGIASQNAAIIAAQKARQQAIAPAVSSLEASIPEQSAKFTTERTRLQGQVDPLKARYDNILTGLANKQQVAETGATKVTNRELARRGVQLDSTMAGQELENVLNPIRSEYAGLTTETNLSREDQLRAINDLIAGLAPQEAEDIRTIRNAIAQLQAGAGNSAIDDAFRQISFAEQQRQFNESNALAKAAQELQKREFEASQASSNELQKLLTLGRNSTIYDPNTGRFITPPTSGGGSVSGSGRSPTPLEYFFS